VTDAAASRPEASAPVGLLLAAGAGRRFGGPKAVALLDGERLVDRAVRTLHDGGCSDVLAVAGAVPLRDVDAQVVTNVDWPSGMGSSLRCGLAAAGRGRWPAAVVLLVDTPWVGSGAVRRVLDAWAATRPLAAQGGEPLLALQATYDGVPGHPVLLAREVWTAVGEAAVDDRGARAWLAAHPGDVRHVPCEGTGDPRDVDLPDDLNP